MKRASPCSVLTWAGSKVSNTQKVLDGDLDAFIEASLKQGV